MALIHLHLPRLPLALARHQESLPLSPKYTGPPPVVLSRVISLKEMCSKFWLERVQYVLRRNIPKWQVFAVQRFLEDLPRNLRAMMIHNALKAGGLHLRHGSRELAAINRALVLLSPDIPVTEPVYVTLPRPGPEGAEWPLDIDLILRNGEGLSHLVLTMPPLMTDAVKRVFSDLCRTCKKLSRVRLIDASDDALTLLTRYCHLITHLDVSGSAGITDEGINRIIVNLLWGGGDEPVRLRHIDVGGTSVTQEGVATLLTRLPELTSLGSTDVVEALKIMDELSDGAAVTTLEEVNVRCVTINNLQLLRRMCPAVSNINAIINYAGVTINDLRLLRELRQLKLSVQEPYLLSPTALYEFAWSVGTQLVTLRLEGDVYWEADLGVLAGNCPHLEELALPAITVPTRESLAALTNKDSIALAQLKVLELDCMTGVGPKAWAKDFTLVRRGMTAALSKCRQLRRLICRPTNLVETDLLEILSVNRMTRLEVLELYNCVLGLASARLLVDTCESLHVMKGLRTWRGLTLQDLVLLRRHTRGHRRTAELKILP
ncbi:uncharacterized protein LOC126995673 [Eriocheir sinensis]|uniref:uncharacterized protein LOC126995673 n=1 Tax=Eriocheir sinensis TaxID=95602 RepID=UPI0021C89905|nr:uncharacterized protein LOC126995673 [Eriocheir sinensis]XP_050711404.1 uncharacterized protein LOC126995673 [Eriocheir sinensis]XP_050711405.1 uncharacterized protein LOC126995673 [Eriocheir sinensis]XP_050711406.1 uncharacterized protein LOC126995673 [Eriocheir sinensis]